MGIPEEKIAGPYTATRNKEGISQNEKNGKKVKFSMVEPNKGTNKGPNKAS